MCIIARELRPLYGLGRANPLGASKLFAGEIVDDAAKPNRQSGPSRRADGLEPPVVNAMRLLTQRFYEKDT
jgi:hypothetical protein